MLPQVIFISSSLVIVAVAIHLFLLRGLSYVARRMRHFPVLGMGVSMVAAIGGHVTEIWIFAIAIKQMALNGQFGSLA
ncbi:hypothetical protein NG895_16665, partial [Aeoliella sp. ICT_H6.2]